MGASQIQPVPFRLIIGVTGHRTLENTGELRETVRRILAEVIKKHSNAKHTDIKLAALSPLAEGADRLVAEEVLAYDEGSYLKAVLPLSLSDYLDDFKTNESKHEFRDLLHKAKYSHSLRERDLVDDYPLDMLNEARSFAYEDVGKFVVDHCDVLIAIWDEEQARGLPGTANIVTYAKSVKCPVYVINPEKPSRFNLTRGKGLAKELLKKTDAFNRNIKESPSISKYVENQDKELFDNTWGEKLPEHTRSLVRQKLIPYYAAASIKAKYYQNIYRRTGIRSFLLAFFAVAFVGAGVILKETFPDFFNQYPYIFKGIFAVELVVLAYIFGSIFIANRKKAHKNWMGYRYLAERLRSSFFNTVCGLNVSHPYIKRHPGEHGEADAWMHLVFEEICHGLPVMSGTSQDNCSHIADYINEAWIQDQINYHDGNSKKNSKRSWYSEVAGESVFAAAIAVAALHLTSDSHLLTWLTIIFPSLAATLESIRSHREYKRLSMRSRKMITELEDLQKMYRLMTPKKLEHLVRKTEHIMMEESKEWMTLMSPMELHRVV